jgi:hypothetical protein
MITRKDKQQQTKHWNLTFLGRDSAGVWLFNCGSYWHGKESTLFSVHEWMQLVGSMFWPEWTSTHQCTNVDGWCTDRILFSIPVPSQVHFFLFAVSQPWSQFFFAFETFPTYPPTTPIVPTDLLTYIFKLKVDSSPSTYSPINLQCASLIPAHLPTPQLFL